MKGKMIGTHSRVRGGLYFDLTSPKTRYQNMIKCARDFEGKQEDYKEGGYGDREGLQTCV
jgi:hypothetical protein